MKKKKSILFSAFYTQQNSILVRAAIELLHGGLVVAAAWEAAVIVNTVFMEHGGPMETASDLLMLFLCVLSMALLKRAPLMPYGAARGDAHAWAGFLRRADART